MSAALKCPNPSCPFLFDPTQVPPGAVLTCPRCTMRFTLGTTGAAAPQNEFATAAMRSKTSEDAEPAEKPSLLTSRKTLVMGIAAGMAVIFAILALFFSQRPARETYGVRDNVFTDINLVVHVPEGWDADDDLRLKMNVNVLAMRKVESSARFAIASLGYSTRMPQPGELREGLTSERLRKYFDDLDATPSEGTWLGQPALKLTFRGRGIAADGTYAGEAYALCLNGRAYWFLAWSLESEWAAVSSDIESIRTGCKLIKPDLEWTPSENASVAIVAESGDYHVTDGDRWWEKQSDPSTEDAKADLLMKAKYRTRPMSDRPPQAWAVAYLLPGDDPMTAVREHVKARYAKLFDIKKLTELSDAPLGDPPASGMTATKPVLRFHGEHESANVEKLVVISAIKTGKGIVGFEAWCPWSDRDKWEKRLIALASSLSPGR